MHAVDYRTTGISEIELIRPLWEQLNGYHLTKASHFRMHYERMTFEELKIAFQPSPWIRTAATGSCSRFCDREVYRVLRQFRIS